MSINNNISKVAENTFARFSASIMDKGFFFLLMLYFTRYLGAAIYGEYLIVMTFVNIFRVFVNFGMNALFVRDLARDFSKLDDYLGNSFVISMGSSLFYYIILIISAILLEYSDKINTLIAVAGLSLFPFSISMIFDSILTAKQCMKQASICTVINSLLTSISSIILLFLGYGLKYIFIALIAINFIYACCLYYSIIKLNIKLKLKCNINIIYNIIKDAFPFAMFFIMYIVYNSQAIVILSKIEPGEIVGWYGAPLRFLEVLLIVPVSLGVALFPVMSRHFTESIVKLWNSYEKILRYLIIIVIPIGLSFAVMSEPIVVLLFGNKFLPSAPAMSLLTCAVMFTFVNVASTMVIWNSNYYNRYAFFYLIFMLFSIMTNYFCILEYSYIGAAIAKIITECFMFFIQLYFIKLIFNKIPNIIKLSYKPLIAVVCMSVGLFIFKSMPVILLLVCSFCVYFIILFFLGEFSKEEIAQFKSIFSN